MAGWNEYAKPEVRALQGISRRSEVPSKDFQKNLANVNQSIKYMSEMMGIMQGGIDDANKDIIQKIKDAIDDILIIFGLGGGDTLSFDWGDLQVIFQHFNQIFNLPNFFGPGGIDILGFGKNFFDMILKPLGDFGSFISNSVNGFFEFLFSLLEGIPFIGGFIQSIAGGINGNKVKAETAVATVVTTQNQVTYIQEVINVRSGRSLADSGPDPTGDPTFSFSDIQLISTAPNVTGGGGTNNGHTHPISNFDDYDRVTITSSNYVMANVRFGGAVKKRVLTYLGYKTGNPQLYFDLYKMEANGDYTFVQSSSDQAVNMGGLLAAYQAVWPNDFLVDIGDVFMVQIRVEGTGTVVIPAKRTVTHIPIASFVPRTIAATRNPNGTSVPLSISASQYAVMSSFTIPWFSIGMDLGVKAALRQFSDNFNRSNIGPNYYQFMPGRASGNAPQIYENALSYNRSTGTDGYGGAVYIQPLISDRWYFEWRCGGMNDKPFGIYIGGSDGRGGGFLWDTAQGLRPFQTDSDDWASSHVFPRPSIILPGSAVGGGNLWRGEYNPDNNRFSFFRNNSETSVATYVDTNNYIPHGPGKRYFGGICSRFTFQTSWNVDDLSFGDLEAPAA